MPSHPIISLQSDFDAIALSIAKGDWVVAQAQADRLLEKDASNPEAWHIKGDVHKRTKDYPTAITCFNQVLKLMPEAAGSCLELAQTLELSHHLPLALKTYEHWLKILQSGPKPAVHVSESDTKIMEGLFAQGTEAYYRGEMDAAIWAFRKILEIYPNEPSSLLNLGMALYHIGRVIEAKDLLLKAIGVTSDNVEALNALGNCLSALGAHAAAAAAYRQAVVTNPRYAQAWINLGKSYYFLKLYVEAIHAYEQTLALEPDNADATTELMHMLCFLCRWDEAEKIRPRFNQLIRDGKCAEPFMVVAHAPDLQLGNARHWAKRFFPATTPYNSAFTLPVTLRGDGRLRIGYISSDLQQHATTALISELFEQHDKTRFSIYAYSYGKDDGGPERKRVIQAVDVFRDISTLDDRTSDALIRSDGIDIIVELKGYTLGNRLAIQTHRPAPIQIHYLGYPGSIGTDFIDYFIADPHSTPPGAEAWFSEKLIRLPYTYQMNDRKRPLADEVPPRSAYQLPEEGFVFCDFNNPYKITPPVFAVWMRLLKAIPGSVFWLHQTVPEAGANLKLEAKKQGIDPTRIILAPAIPMAQHLMRYQHVDLFLDTTPYSGHTTTSDALWCGAPVVTLTGDSFCSRVAAGLLQAVGLPELITDNLADYEALALKLAQDKPKLAELREYLKKGRMQFPLFDSLATTRAIEAAYLHAAELHKSDKKPQAFSIMPDLRIL